MVKRQRLSDFGRVSHVTARGLAAVLRQIQEEGLPDAVSRSSVARHRREDVQRQTDFGDLLQEVPVVLKSGGEGTVWVQHPLAMLATVASEFPEIAALMASMAMLEIVLYSDEITPGQQIKGNDRKCQTIYWSLINFGPELLCFESMWFTAAALRASQCKRIQGGMSQVYKLILRLFFGGRGRHDLRNGIMLHLHGSDRPKLVLGRLAAFLQDERGGKEFALFKGASGVKLCCLCRTTCGHKTLVIRGGGAGFVSAMETDVAKLELHTRDSIRAIVDRLHEVAQSGDNGLLARLEKAHGFNYDPEWLLLDQNLSIDLPSLWMWDWFHTYLADGVFVQEVDACMEAFGEHGFGMHTLNEYIKLWSWPRGFAHAMKVCLHDDGTVRHGLNGTASELWSLVPVLLKFVQDVVEPRGIAAIQLGITSLRLLLFSVMLLGNVITGKVSGEELERAIVAHLDAHKAAWGDALWLPKHHYALHLGKLLNHHGYLLATFTHERKHRLVKRFLNPRLNTNGLERGVMEELTLQHLYELRDLVGIKTAALQNKRLATAEERAMLAVALPAAAGADVLMGSVAKVKCRPIHSHDVVLFHHGLDEVVGAGEIQFHIAIGDDRWTCVAVWELLSTERTEAGTARLLKCRVRDNDTRLLPTSQLLESAIFSKAAVGEISTVIVPLSLQLGGEDSRASRG